ncbi:hypothetical protein AGMMS49975_24510 [Clostridia bacterium]|nr:hypothetical protein AGMMS49975_24510 [Clostridia bacterium]GHU75451.1 hypothetical protein FACS1894188_06350 [Clostridia bacterium]
MNQKVRILSFSALCVALASVLSMLKLFEMPQGGAVSAFSMIFIVLIGYWFGASAGLVGAFVFSLIQLMTSHFILNIPQVFLDYILAFTALGLSGFFRKMPFGLYIGFFVGCLVRLTMSTISGVVFYADYAPSGQSPFLYSIIYNGSYIGAEMVLTMILLSIPPVKHAINRVTNMVK